MKEFYIDCTGLGKEDLHRALAECLDFPEWYGNNLDALYDELTEISQETLVILCNFNAAEPSCKGFKRVLKDAGLTVSITSVITACIHNRPGGLAEVLKLLSTNDIQIEYMYAFIAKDRAHC